MHETRVRPASARGGVRKRPGTPQTWKRVVGAGCLIEGLSVRSANKVLQEQLADASVRSKRRKRMRRMCTKATRTAGTSRLGGYDILSRERNSVQWCRPVRVTQVANPVGQRA